MGTAVPASSGDDPQMILFSKSSSHETAFIFINVSHFILFYLNILEPFIQVFRRPLFQAIPIIQHEYLNRKRHHTKSFPPFGTDLAMVGATTLVLFASCA